jgi:biotin carboxyl carrier protein
MAGQVLAGQVLADRAVDGADDGTARHSTVPHLMVWDWPIHGVGGRPPVIVRPFEPPVRRWDPGHRGLDLVSAVDSNDGTSSGNGNGINPRPTPNPAIKPTTTATATATPMATAPSAPTTLPTSTPTPPPTPPPTAPETPTPTNLDPVHAAGAGTVVFAGTLFGRGVVSISHGALRTSYSPVSPLVHTGDQVTPGQVIGLLEPGHCPGRPCLHWGLLTGHGRRIRYYDPSILLGPGRVRLEPVRSR